MGMVELNPLLAAILTVAFGSFLFYEYRRWRERTNLRTALQNEVHDIGKLIEDVSDENLPTTPEAHKLIANYPTIIYQQNINKIGYLKTSELASIVDFYTDFIQFKNTVEEYEAYDESEEIEESIWMIIPDLRRKKDAALERMEGNISESFFSYLKSSFA